MRKTSPRWRIAARRRRTIGRLSRTRRGRTSTGAGPIVAIVIRRRSSIVDEPIVAVVAVVAARARGAIVGIIGRFPFGCPALAVDEAAEGMVSFLPL